MVGQANELLVADIFNTMGETPVLYLVDQKRRVNNQIWDKSSFSTNQRTSSSLISAYLFMERRSEDYCNFRIYPNANAIRFFNHNTTYGERYFIFLAKRVYRIRCIAKKYAINIVKNKVVKEFYFFIEIFKKSEEG